MKYMEYAAMTDRDVQKLVDAGAKRWTRGSMDRLYINAGALGYEWDCYKTGNISNAFYKGERISNSEMGRVLAAKVYIDVADGSVHCNRESMLEAAEVFVADALREEEPEAEEIPAAEEAGFTGYISTEADVWTGEFTACTGETVKVSEAEGGYIMTVTAATQAEAEDGFWAQISDGIFENVKGDVVIIDDKAAEIINAGRYEAAVELMDDTIRERVHGLLAPCPDAAFLSAYMERHKRAFGEDFRI